MQGDAAIVRIDHDIRYRVGTTRAISRRPIVGWHQFGVVPPVAGDRGYRMVVSRAGDWTGEFIDDTPTHVWVRGVPAVGVATTEFNEGAKAQAKSLGTDPALVFIPHPVQDRTDDELHKLADDHFDAIVKLLVK